MGKRKIDLFRSIVSPTAGEALTKLLTPKEDGSLFIGEGPKVKEFEDLLKKKLHTQFVNTVNSCTSGLQLAVHMVANPTDKHSTYGQHFLCCSLSCSATPLAIHTNKIPIRWVDTDPDTCNVDLDDLERKLNEETMGVMIVHWGGNPVDPVRLWNIKVKFQERYNRPLPIIADCAHAWGTTFCGFPINLAGAYDYSVYSFGPIKHLNTGGNGGAVVTLNSEDHKRAKLLRWYGFDRESKFEFRCSQMLNEGYHKIHMTDVEATFGIENFKNTDAIVQRHKDNALFYDDALSQVGDVWPIEPLHESDPAYWVYTIKVQRRDDFQKHMEECGIMTSRVHDRCDKHPIFDDYKAFFPGLDELCKTMVAIPCGSWVTDEDRRYIVNCILNGW